MGGMNPTQILRAPHRTAGPILIIAGAAVALTAGCHRPIIVQAPPATVIQQAPAPAVAPAATTPPPVIVVNQPPPAPLHDTQVPQPSPEDVWIPGYWAWRNNQQQWIPGHWAVPPHPGATWVPARWEQRGSEYVFIDGYWQ